VKLIKEAIRLPQKLTIPAETRQAQQELLKRPVPPVTNAVTQQFAVDVGREIRGLENSVEKLRKDMTKPLRDLIDQINKICGDYSEPLTTRREQLQKAVNEFGEAEEKRVQLETAARLEELKRLQAPVETNGDVSQQELTAYRNEQQAEELMRAPLPEVQKANGAATRKDLGWECTDPIALWNARPELCHPPQPKPSAIRLLCVPEMPVVGLKLWWEKNTTIRTR
jgi:hypothetical protein